MALSRRWFLAGLAAAIATAGVSADARMHAPYRGHRILPANAAPLDGFTQPSGAYSFRKLRSTYAGPAIRIRRASDNAELDINFLGCTSFTGCPWDSAAATAHCAATPCSVVTWYDQSGLARDLTQATQANQPALVFNCIGTLPCLQTSTLTQAIQGPSVTPATGLASISVVANRVSGTGFCILFRQDGATGNRVYTNSVAGQWAMAGSAGTILATASTAAWHAAQGIFNGASSVLSIDSTDTAGSVTNSVAAGAVGIVGSNTTVCSQAEEVVWDNYQLTPGEKTTLTANQRAFWGF